MLKGEHGKVNIMKSGIGKGVPIPCLCQILSTCNHVGWNELRRYINTKLTAFYRYVLLITIYIPDINICNCVVTFIEW